MSTLSVPIPQNLEKFIDDMIKQGKASNKAELVRRALDKYAEDQAVEMVMQSMREYKEGKVLEGDLNELLKKMP